jgi:hypothetical protein
MGRSPVIFGKKLYRNNVEMSFYFDGERIKKVFSTVCSISELNESLLLA